MYSNNVNYGRQGSRCLKPIEFQLYFQFDLRGVWLNEVDVLGTNCHIKKSIEWKQVRHSPTSMRVICIFDLRPSKKRKTLLRYTCTETQVCKKVLNISWISWHKSHKNISWRYCYNAPRVLGTLQENIFHTEVNYYPTRSIGVT